MNNENENENEDLTVKDVVVVTLAGVAIAYGSLVLVGAVSGCVARALEIRRLKKNEKNQKNES